MDLNENRVPCYIKQTIYEIRTFDKPCLNNDALQSEASQTLVCIDEGHFIYISIAFMNELNGKLFVQIQKQFD